MSKQVSAPFTDDQVDSLNAFQAFGASHPFTCGGDNCREVLRATSDGWVCPKCGHRQDWAHSFMVDWSWKRVPNEESNPE